MRFEKKSPAHFACSAGCALEIIRIRSEKAKASKAKAARKDIAERKEKLKTRSDWIKAAQVAFNAFIRERDKNLPCICCSKTSTKEYLTGSNWDCGHYRSTGSAPHLRFHENNAHRQLSICNQHGSGRAVDYRIGLIARIGIEAVEALEVDNEPRKHTIDELKAIQTLYRTKLKELKQ